MLLKSSTLKISETGLPFKLDQRIADFLSELLPDELRRLEESIKKSGCRDPLVVWKEENILLDGYHRLALSQKHDKSFHYVYESFPSRADALIWIMDNNKGRRCHGDAPYYDCEKVIKEFEEYFREKAQEKKREAGKVHGRGQKVSQQDGKPIHVDEELAKLAGWSAEAIRMTRYIMKHGTPQEKKILRERRSKLSLRRVYERTKHNVRFGMQIDVIRKAHKREWETDDYNLAWGDDYRKGLKEVEKQFEKDRAVIHSQVKQMNIDTNCVIGFLRKVGLYEEAIGAEELEILFKNYNLESSLDKLSEMIQDFKKRNSSK